MKDFAGSFEQLQWEHAVKFHQRYAEMLATATHDAIKESLRKRISEIELQFPQLKADVNKQQK